MNSRRFRQRGQGKAAGIVVLLLALVAGGGGAYWYLALRSTPEKTVQQFVDASLAKDQAGLEATLSAGSKKLFAGSPKAGMMQLPGASNPAAKPAIGAAMITGDKAEVPVVMALTEQEAKFLGNKDLTMTMALVKEDGHWKVDLMATMQAMMKTMQSLLQKMPRGIPGMPAQ